MFLIDCPWCGARDQSEFRCGGEAHIARPAAPDALDDAAWADYVFNRTNPKGLHLERWVHVHGCRRWFNVARDTATDTILRVYPMGAPVPADLAGAARPAARDADPCDATRAPAMPRAGESGR